MESLRMLVRSHTIWTFELFLSIILTNIKYANLFVSLIRREKSIYFSLLMFLRHTQDQQNFRLIQGMQAADKWNKQTKTLKRFIADENAKWYSNYGKQFGSFWQM